MFAVYCGLALHHAKLYDKIRRSEQKYKVALEVLSYHNSSSLNELEEILADGVPSEDKDDIARYLQARTFLLFSHDESSTTICKRDQRRGLS